MTKLQIIGPKTLLDDCVKSLHGLSVLHLEPVGLKDFQDDAAYIPIEKDILEKKKILEDSLEKAKNILLMLPHPAGEAGGKADKSDETITYEIKEIEHSVKTLFLEKENLEEEIRNLKDYETILTGFAPIASALGGLKKYEIMGLTVDTKRINVINLLHQEINKITQGRYEIHTNPINSNTTGIVLAVLVKEAPDVRRLLFGEGIQELKLPAEYEEQPLLKAIKAMASRQIEAARRLMHIRDELKVISNQWNNRIQEIILQAKTGLDEIEAMQNFAHTRYCFIIEGWIPRDSLKRVNKTIDGKFQNKILVREMNLSKDEVSSAPVCIENHRWIRPFEVFLKALPTPKYGSIDPTPLIAFFFPAFFGLIVGDIGYGIIIAMIGLAASSIFKPRDVIGDLMKVFIISGLSAAFFGFLFGELFGTLGEELHLLKPVWFDRLKAIRSFLVIAVGIGAGHVLLGILIGVYNKLKQKHFREASVKLLFFILITSFIVIMLSLFNLVSAEIFTPVFFIFIIMFLLLLIMEGVLGLVEFVEGISNILSYIRIMAIGASSVILALVANKVGEAMGNITAGITVAVLIHIMNIIISLMSPTIQSMRLQYVEFLGKFYEDGGRPYSPFKK